MFIRGVFARAVRNGADAGQHRHNRDQRGQQDILLAALISVVPVLTGIRAIPDGTGKNTSDEHKTAEKGLPFYRDFQLMLIGVVVLAMA